MTTPTSRVAALASDLVRLDSRSSLTNLAIAERLEAELAGFDVERIDYEDAAGVAKRALVARRGRAGGLAFSGHMDTVPATGWSVDPWDGRIADGLLHGLGATDMKGPVAAAIVAAQSLPPSVPVALLLTTDEETTKAGARAIADRSELARGLDAVLVVEPTGMVPMRGHRAHIHFTATATGIQAHSSTGKGRNANWDLVPFLVDMKALFERLAADRTLQDESYDPVSSDFNLVLNNHGTAVNVTVAKATADIKFRYSAKIDPFPIVGMVRDAAARAGLDLVVTRDGDPPELPADHPFVQLCVSATGAGPNVAPYGTDAAELQVLAPCVILGPGDIGVAHKPGEAVRIADLEAAVPTFMRLAESVASRS